MMLLWNRRANFGLVSCEQVLIVGCLNYRNYHKYVGFVCLLNLKRLESWKVTVEVFEISKILLRF